MRLCLLLFGASGVGVVELPAIAIEGRCLARAIQLAHASFPDEGTSNNEARIGTLDGHSLLRSLVILIEPSQT